MKNVRACTLEAEAVWVYSGAPFLLYPPLLPTSLTALALSRVLIGRKAVYMWVDFCVTVCLCLCVFLSNSRRDQGTPHTEGQGAVDSLDEEFEDMGLASA